MISDYDKSGPSSAENELDSANNDDNLTSKMKIASTDVFSNIRNILEQSLLNQNQLMDQLSKESYEAILKIINEYDNERRNKRSTLDGTDESNQVLLEQSNEDITVSTANSKRGIKCEEAADLLSDEDPISMLSPSQSPQLLKKAISANESMLAVKNNAIVKASKSQNKPQRQLKFNGKNDNANAGDTEVGSSNKPKRLNLPKGKTTNELQTEQGNDKLISKANQSQVSGFNETSDNVSASDKTILSPIFKSWRSPRSKNQSVIVNNTKNMMTSTPNQNSCEQPKTKVITKELFKKEKTSKSDSARKVKEKQIVKEAIVSSDSECQNTCKKNEVEDINVKEIETKAIATSAIKKGTKNKDQQDIRNTSTVSPRKIKHLQNMIQTLITSFFDIFNENKIEDKNETNANATGAIKKGTKNKKDQQVIRNTSKLSARKLKELQNMKETIVTSLSEEEDTCNENEVEDINVKESETNANATGAIKKENKTNKQVIRNNLKASTNKVENLQAKKKAIVLTALEEQDSCSEIDNEVKNKEKINIRSISQKRAKAAENKQVKNKKVKVSTIKVKESPKKNISITAKEHVSCSEKDHDEGKENKSNRIVASTSQKVTKTVERQQAVRKNTSSKRKLKETQNKKHGGTVASEEGTSHISKKKPKLNEVPNKNTTISTDDEMDEVSPKKRASNCMQNSSKYVCNFSLHNGENSSIKKESGSVYDKKRQRLCDELNASRKSFDFSFDNASLNDSVRRSGRSRKPPKLIECMYIRTVESSTSGKKSMSRKSTAVSQTDLENDDIKKENLQVASQSKEKKSMLRTKKTSVLKSSTMKKTEKEDLGINEASSLFKPNKNVGNKNLGNESKISQTFTEKRKTADEDNVYSSQDNESTAESQISGVQSTSSYKNTRKLRYLPN